MKSSFLRISFVVLFIILSKSGFNQRFSRNAFPLHTDLQSNGWISGKRLFFGTWSDNQSSLLTINIDSTFTYTRGNQGNPILISGIWKRNLDTFYFNSIQKVLPAEVPAELIYFRNRLYRVDDVKTSYNRSKKYNLNYFDSSYYYHAMERKFIIGMGIITMFTAIPENPTVSSFGFTLSPRYLFSKTINSYFSVGSPFTLGFSYANVPTTVVLDGYGPHLGILLDFPLIFNYNHKWGTSSKRSRFEYFTGIGAAYHLNDYSVTNGTTKTIDHLNGFGPVFNAGLRYSFTKYRVANLEVKFSYLKMIVSARPNIFGFSLLVNK